MRGLSWWPWVHQYEKRFGKVRVSAPPGALYAGYELWQRERVLQKISASNWWDRILMEEEARCTRMGSGIVPFYGEHGVAPLGGGDAPYRGALWWERFRFPNGLTTFNTCLHEEGHESVAEAEKCL